MRNYAYNRMITYIINTFNLEKIMNLYKFCLFDCLLGFCCKCYYLIILLNFLMIIH